MDEEEEGYDYQEGGDGYGPDGLEGGEEEDYGPTVDELIERGQQEQLRLQELNEMLQKRARLVLDHRNKGRPPANRDLSMLDGVVTRYRWVGGRKEASRLQKACRNLHVWVEV